MENKVTAADPAGFHCLEFDSGFTSSRLFSVCMCFLNPMVLEKIIRSDVGKSNNKGSLSQIQFCQLIASVWNNTADD